MLVRLPAFAAAAIAAALLPSAASATTTIAGSVQPAAGTQMVLARGVASAITLSDGRVLIIGGTGGDGRGTSYELFSPFSEGFSSIVPGTMNAERQVPMLAARSDGSILIAGGTPDRAAESYASGAFTTLSSPQLTMPRFGATFTKIADGRVLIVGGIAPNPPLGDESAPVNSSLASTETYVPSSGT